VVDGKCWSSWAQRLVRSRLHEGDAISDRIAPRAMKLKYVLELYGRITMRLPAKTKRAPKIPDHLIRERQRESETAIAAGSFEIQKRSCKIQKSR